LPSSPSWDKELNFGVPISKGTRGVKVEPLSKRCSLYCFQNQNPPEREKERGRGRAWSTQPNNKIAYS